MLIFLSLAIFISFAIHTFLSLKKYYSSEKRPKSPKKIPNILIIFFKIVNNNYKTVLVILLRIFIYIIIYVYIQHDKPVLLCDHFDDLSNGTINRTPLLQPGQTIRTLPHGSYPVTGGQVHIGHLGNGHVTKVIGITVNGHSGINYIQGTQPFNRNYGSVLYELLQAGKTNVSHSALDTIYTNNRELVTPLGNFHAHFLETFRAHAGMKETEYGDTTITAKIINGIAK